MTLSALSSNNNIEGPKGPVQYDSHRVTQVLFQRVGSIWPSVFPYCFANVALMVVLKKLQQNDIVDCGINSLGHTFAGVIVSFLVVSRINTSMARYSQTRGFIGIMYQACRETVQNTLVLSKRYDNNNDTAAKEWRNEVAYRALLLLRASVAVVEFDSHQIPAWEIYEMSGVNEFKYCRPTEAWRRYQLTPNTARTHSMKVPHRVAYLLRESILSGATRLQTPIHVAQENRILANVDQFLSGYYGMRKFMTTPVPFPLIQMTLTIVLIYVFTIPFVFLQDTSDMLYEHCVVVFFLTYGFMGLEMVSIGLDDPFGKDPNDFDVRAYAKVAVEDVYLLVHDADGEVWADSLMDKMTRNAPKPSANERSNLV